MTLHVVVDLARQVVRCDRCGASQPLGLPDEALAFARRLREFTAAHRACPPPARGAEADASGARTYTAR